MDKPLFSICIPTFNRCEFLKNTINSIVTQPEFLNGKTEILISDNVSEDNTPVLCAEYVKRYSNFYYHRNTQNIGDKNFPVVLSKAHGILRRLNNDSYVLENGALAAMCGLAEKYMDTRPFILFTDSNRPPVTKGLIPFHEFVVQASFMITWIGGFSIWENECGGIENDTEACKLNLWQVSKAYELGYKKDACVIFNDCIGKTQQVQKRDLSYGLFKVFYSNYLSILKTYVENKALTVQEYEYLRKDLLYNFLTTRIIDWELQRKKIQYSATEDFKKMVFDAYKDEPYWEEYLSFYNKKIRKRKFKLFFQKLFGNE